MDYNNKTVWVTGASSGIGRALVVKLDSLGAKLILSGRQNEALKTTLDACRYPDRHSIVQFDLAQHAELSKIVQDVWCSQPVDILFNNGGVSQRSLALDTLLAVDKQIMDVDYFGTITLTKAVVSNMITNGGGCIVNIASVAGKVGSPLRSAYSGAKHALIGFMDCLRAETQHLGIRVVNICPGFVKTNISQNAMTGDLSSYNQMDQEIENGIPVEKFVEQLLKALNSKKAEVVIADGMPWLGYHLRRLAPNLFIKVLPKIYQRKTPSDL